MGLDEKDVMSIFVGAEWEVLRFAKRATSTVTNVTKNLPQVRKNSGSPSETFNTPRGLDGVTSGGVENLQEE